MLGLIKRKCHFVVNSILKRTLYMAMVRSQFEHCLIIWRSVSETKCQKFESIQTNGIKWILNEGYISYSDKETYLRKCKEVDMLPIYKKFDLNDLILFHKIINGYVQVKLPNYICKYDGTSRLGAFYLDSECLVCNLNNLDGNYRSLPFNNFYYRVMYYY